MLADAVIDVIVGRVESITSPFSQVGIWSVDGAVSRTAPDATAVGKREVGFEISIGTAWQPPTPDSQRHIAWVRDGWEQIRPFSAGVYANFLSDEGAEGIEAAYGERLQRLTALKDRYDAENVFFLNANIPPSRRP